MKRILISLICTCLLLAQGTALAVYATEQTTSDSQTEEQFTQTCLPTAATYIMINPSGGYAGGTLSVSLPEKHNVISVSVYWGDANGKPLPDFAPLKKQSVTSSAFSMTLGYNNSVPVEAKTLLVYTYSTRFGQSLSPYVVTLPTVTLPQTGQKLAELQIVSDLHLGVNQTASDRFVAMLKDIATTSPSSSGIIAVGDLVDAADDEYYALLDSLYASVSGVPHLYRGIGHHEYLTRGTYDYDATAHDANLQKFLKGVKLPSTFALTTPYYTCFIAGHTAIFLGADAYENGNAVYSQAQLTWLDNVLKVTSRENPVFIFMHEPLPQTVAGSIGSQGYGNVSNPEQVLAVLEKYDNVFVFSGHTHWTMEANRNAYFVNDVRYFNTAAVCSLWNDVDGNGYEVDGSQGYYVTIYEDALLIRGRDFTTGQWLPNAYYLISTKLPEQSTTASTTKPSTSTTKPADTDGQTEEDDGLTKEKLIVLVALAGIVAVLAFVALFGIQPKPSEPNDKS